MKQFNGWFGCTFCLVEGENIRSQVYYPAHKIGELRTHDEILEDMVLAAETGEEITGVLRASAFIILPEFDLGLGPVVDIFNCMYEGVVKRLTNLILENMNQVDKKMVSNRMQYIRTPTRLSRYSRSIDDIKDWKCSEWENWLLYYAPVVLDGIVDDRVSSEFWKTNSRTLPV